MHFLIYVHVPFCLTRCGYCNFYSGEPLEARPKFPALVLEEARHRRSCFGEGLATSIYIGGGTPSLLGEKPLEGLVGGLLAIFEVAPDAEITVEVNPSSSLDFRNLANSGINRVSVGVQAMQERNLKILGRPHGAGKALSTVINAVESGMNVSADLIYGYRGLTTADLLESARIMVESGVKHLSAYSLETGGGGRPKGRLKAAGEKRVEEQGAALLGFLAKAGLRCYEVSNFAIPGFESGHNLGYWRGEAYLGLGPGAHGFFPLAGENGMRYANAPDLAGYASAIDSGEVPPGAEEYPTHAERVLEKLFLALRQTARFDPKSITTNPVFNPLLEMMADSGDLVRQDRGLYVPTPRGLFRADGLALWLHSKLFP